LPTLLLRYAERNESTTYNYGAPIVNPGGGNSYESTINMKVRIPLEQPIWYEPPTIEVMKFAWVQYVGLLIPTLYLIWLFVSFVYGNKIMDTTQVYPQMRRIPDY
jgi:transmembrane protein 231